MDYEVEGPDPAGPRRLGGRRLGGLLVGAAGLSAIGLAVAMTGGPVASQLTSAHAPAGTASATGETAGTTGVQPGGSDETESSASANGDAAPRLSTSASSSSGAAPSAVSGTDPDHEDVTGTVGTVGTNSFTVTESNGTTVTVDVSSGTGYTDTQPSTVSAATPNSWIQAKGARASDASLAATAMAIVPAPAGSTPSGSTSRGSSSGGSERSPFVFGEVTANNGTNITVSTHAGTETVTTGSVSSVTDTTLTTFSDVQAGKTVQVDCNGTSTSATVAAEHVNVGVAPAVRSAGRSGDGESGGPGPHTDVSGTVTSVGTNSFAVKESNGTTVTVDEGSATRYTQTQASSVVQAVPGTYVAAKGTRASDGSLAATGLAVVPAPSSGADHEAAEGPDSGSVLFGKVTANNAGTLTVSTGSGSETVTTGASTTVTKTTTSDSSVVTDNAAVRAEGTANSDGTVAAEQVNVGVTPAVSGGPDGGGGSGPGGPAGGQFDGGQDGGWHGGDGRPGGTSGTSGPSGPSDGGQTD